jgi:hypothetical protein
MIDTVKESNQSVLDLCVPTPDAPRATFFGAMLRFSSDLFPTLRSIVNDFAFLPSPILFVFLRSSTTILVLSPRSMGPAAMAACSADWVENSTNPHDCQVKNIYD